MNTTAINWDQWRADYDTMTFREHQEFNSMVAEQYPVQRAWDRDAVAQFIRERNPHSVVELGGWDGALAAEMLGEFPDIITWVNYDITPDVPQVCDHPAYERVVLFDWPWKFHITGDALIASHVFEHMRIGEVAKLVSLWDVDSIYADVPIRGNPDWRGYEGTHILEASPHEFFLCVESAGYELHNLGRTPQGFVAFLDKP